MLSKLSESGTAGFVLANGSMSTNTSGEGEIRKQLIENDHVDCMIALPGQLFYTTQIPVCLWFITKNKSSNRKGKTLFIDARQMGTMMSRIHKELTVDDIAKIADTYHNWKSGSENYTDQAGYCKSASLADIKANDYVLTPGRYVGAADIEDDGIAFETKMTELAQTLFAQMKEAEALDKVIRQNLEVLGYGE